jgi:putative mRNA 3-end processing factor
MKFHCLGAGEEVGRSCFLISSDKRIMLDCGLKIHDKENPQLYPIPPPVDVDLVAISHTHLDHLGFLPSLFDNHDPAVIGTPPTKAIGELLLLDSAKIILEEYGSLPYKRSSHERALKKDYGHVLKIGANKISLHDAGHAPGSSTVLIENTGKKILYTGDFKLEPTRLFEGAEVIKDVDVLIIESTYASRDHPNREDLEQQLIHRAKEVCSEGGNLLLPAFAVGRTQELMMILSEVADEIPIWIDGMGIEASKIMNRFPAYLKDNKSFSKALKSVNCVTGRFDRKKVLSEPSVIISTAGMLQGGPALGYLLSLNEQSEVIFTGYCVEGTNGHKLLNYGYVEKNQERIQPSTPIKYLDFSAHAGRSELFRFIKEANPSKIICVHGDSCSEFAEELQLEGYDATAPKLGDTLNI